jgi:hypothetical protein
MAGVKLPLRRGWTARKLSSAAQADEHDLEYRTQIPESERARQVWTLSEQLYRLAGTFSDEPRLRRSLENLHRR